VKNSFFLVIPPQQKDSALANAYEKGAVSQWINDLPAANPSLATRLFYDYIKACNAVDLSPAQRLEVLEILRPPFLQIEDYLRSRLLRSGFPKGENEQKIMDLIVSLERHFTIGYWIIVRDLTKRDISWFQGRNTALALQRTLKGLADIVMHHYMMFLPIPDWVWIDLHSLYKLSKKVSKHDTKVVDDAYSASCIVSAENTYKQVLMLSLSDPSGLMQKEVGQLFRFIGKLAHLIRISEQPVADQSYQCLILQDQDVPPAFIQTPQKLESGSLFLDLSKFHKTLGQKDKYCSQEDARFSSMMMVKQKSDKLPSGLYDYVVKTWQGQKIQGTSFFADRLDRYISIGLDATHNIMSSLKSETEMNQEILAESDSDRSLSCKFDKDGVLSIGSLVSFRKTNDLETRRSLGIVVKITMPKQDGRIIFELVTLAPLVYPVTYSELDAKEDAEPHKALLYGVKTDKGEKSYIIIESFLHKDEDVLRMYMKDSNFPVVLGDRRNIGLGYWQFECRQIEEKVVAQSHVKKKGFDFI
jgi:hypothetical protein